jgi:uncharacterized protein (TIGR00251 family)
MQSTYYQVTHDVITLKLYVQPGSKKNEVIGLFEGALKIKLATQPIEGQANLALIKYLSQLLKVPKSKIILKKGEKSRHKIVDIQSNDINLIRLLEQSEGNP